MDIKEKDTFDIFKKEILNIKDVDNSTYQEKIVKRHFNSLWIVGILIALTNIYWLIAGTLKFDSALSTTYGISLFGYIAIGILLFVTKFVHFKHKIIYRLILLLFELYSLYFMTLLIIYGNINTVNTVDPSMYEHFGISLASLYIVLIVMFPSPYIIDAVIELGCVILSLFLPKIIPGKEAYNIISYSIIYLFCVVGYITFVHIYKTIAVKENEIENLNQKMVDAAHKDILTKALNRRSLDEYCKYLREQIDIEELGVIMFDIDFFKSYNDTYSHLEGDFVLSKVCGIVEKLLAKEEKFLFRYGGEEFIVISKNPKEDELLNLAFNIKNSIYDANIARNDGCPFDRITITCGVSKISKNKSDYISSSDKQLYIGKRGHKNCVVYKNKEIESN